MKNFINKKNLILIGSIVIVIIILLGYFLSNKKISKDKAITLLKDHYTIYQSILTDIVNNNLNFEITDNQPVIYEIETKTGLNDYYKITDFDTLFSFTTSKFKTNFIDGIFIMEQGGYYYKLANKSIFYKRKVENVKVLKRKKDYVYGQIKAIYYDIYNGVDKEVLININLKKEKDLWKLDELKEEEI